MLDYETRRQQRIERYQELAAKNQAESERRFRELHKQLEISNGQPILIGHHSEKSHRALLKRQDNNIHKGVEAAKTAEYYSRRAASAASNNSVSSDNPEAITLLQDKINRAERNQELMKQANIIIRQYKDNPEDCINRLLQSIDGITEQVAHEITKPDFCGRIGFPAYALQNNNANIRRMKERIAQLQKHSTDESKEIVSGEIRIFDNVELNRIQIFFPGKPSPEVISELKHNAFRWSPSEGAWQSYRNQWQMDRAKRITGVKDEAPQDNEKQPESAPALPNPQQGADMGIQRDFEGKEYIHESKPTGEIIKPSLFDWQRDNDNIKRLKGEV
jgi:hypothetical protein